MVPGENWSVRMMTKNHKKIQHESKHKQTDLEIKIREFSFPNDYKPVYELWENAGSGIQLRRSDEISEIKKKLERDPDLFLVAEYHNEIIGAVLGGYDGRRGLMYHLAVAEEYRQQGIGELLMISLEENLRKKGCIRYYLLVTKDNQTAIKFYKSRGWELLDLFVFAKDIG